MGQTDALRFALGYHHPTTVVLVDDHEPFLKNMQSNIPNQMLHRAFQDPRTALAYLNEAHTSQGGARSLVHRAISYHSDFGHDALLHVDIGMLEDGMLDPRRFALPSVLITDYMMPAMDGLELCRRVTDPSIKKIMLTGAADEKLGIEAFNDGVIDRFVLKDRPDAAERTFELAQDLQRRYFADQQNVFLAASTQISPFFGDVRAAAAVEQVQREGGYVEHYLTKDPLGYFLVHADGRIARLALFDGYEMEQQRLLAARTRAPAEVLAQLTDRSHAAILYETPTSDHASLFDWSDSVFPCVEIEGDQRWWVAIDDNAPTSMDYDPASSCLNAVLYPPPDSGAR